MLFLRIKMTDTKMTTVRWLSYFHWLLDWLQEIKIKTRLVPVCRAPSFDKVFRSQLSRSFLSVCKLNYPPVTLKKISNVPRLSCRIGRYGFEFVCVRHVFYIQIMPTENCASRFPRPARTPAITTRVIRTTVFFFYETWKNSLSNPRLAAVPYRLIYSLTAFR